MNVTTVSASVRFSKALGDGVHKTVELSAEATLEGQETWTEAQAGLYQQLGQQLKALWGKDKVAVEGPGKAVNGHQPSETPAHYCQAHQTEFKRFEKEGRVWYSHKGPDGKWCKEK